MHAHNTGFTCAVLSGNGQFGPAVDTAGRTIMLPNTPISLCFRHLDRLDNVEGELP